jgi:hypothetical protein
MRHHLGDSASDGLVLDLWPAEVNEECVVGRSEADKGILDAATPIGGVAGEAGGVVEDRAEPGGWRKPATELRIAGEEDAQLGCGELGKGGVEDITVGRRLGSKLGAGKGSGEDGEGAHEVSKREAQHDKERFNVSTC